MLDNPAQQPRIISPDGSGVYNLKQISTAQIARIDISDVDLIIVTKSGEIFVIPGGGIAAMGDTPPQIAFTDGTISSTTLFARIGTITDSALIDKIPTSLNKDTHEKPIISAETKDPESLNQELQKKINQLEKEITQQQKIIATQQESIAQAEKHNEATGNTNNSAPLNTHTGDGISDIVQQLIALDQNLHSRDYDYVAPHNPETPNLSPTPPLGFSPPLSLTPVMSILMGNIVGQTEEIIGGLKYIYGGGGAVGSDVTAQIGPRNPLQFSAATITNDDSNAVIYVDGPLVGNTNPAVNHTQFFAKQFVLNISGYISFLNDIVIKNVPNGVTIPEAANQGNGTWILPESYVAKKNAFTLIYDTNNYVPSADNTFSLEFDFSGITTRKLNFEAFFTVKFEYIAATSVDQITNPALVYEEGGLVREIYTLPVLGHPNTITAGNGNNTIYGGQVGDTITLGNGNNTIYDGNGNNIITVGDGLNVIQTGEGNNQVTLGSGGGTFTSGSGNNIYTVNSVSASSSSYSFTATNGNNTLSAGDGNYSVSFGNGNNTLALGSSTATGNGTTTFDTTITLGNGTNSLSAGAGVHSVAVGTGTNSITLGAGNNKITVATGTGANTISTGDGVNLIQLSNGNNNVTVGEGGSTISAGSGTNIFHINTAANSTNLFTVSATDGSNTLTAGGGNYTLNFGNGNNTLALGNSTATGNGTTTFDTTITLGNGTNSLSAGAGVHSVAVGTGTNSVTLGAGNNKITTQGGTTTLNTGSGNQQIVVNSTTGSNKSITVTTTGSGTTTLTGGDNYYTLNLGNSGANFVSIGAGASVISATSSAAANTIATGNGLMTLALGASNANQITIGSSASLANTVALTVGNGNANTIQLVGSSASSGTIAVGSGDNNTLALGEGNYTTTIGGASGVTDISLLTSGGGLALTGGNGNNIVYLGNHLTGSNSIILGNGNNTIYGGLGNNTITTGSGSNVLNLSGVATALTISFTSTTSTASGTNTSYSFSGISTLYGSNFGDTITLGTGSLTLRAGSGNDTITLGSGTYNVYTGNGNNTVTGNNSNTSVANFIYGGTGNNTFLSADAGTTFNGTNGANLATLTHNLAYTVTNTSGTNPFAGATNIPSLIEYSYSGGVATINLYLDKQINMLNLSTKTGAITADFSLGAISSPNFSQINAEFTPTIGYNSINGFTSNSNGGTFTTSFSDGIIIAERGGDVIQDGGTLTSQTLILIANSSSVQNGNDNIFMGPAAEYVVGAKSSTLIIRYGSNAGSNSSQATSANSAGVVVNVDSVAHTFSSILFPASITVSAFSGTNWGSAALSSSSYNFNTGTNSLAWSNGDYFVPSQGTSLGVTQLQIVGNSFYTNLVYGGADFVNFYSGTSGGKGNFFYAGSGGSNYAMSGGYNSAIALVPGTTNIITANNNVYDNTSRNIFFIFDKTLDTGSQASLTSTVSLSWGSETYTGFVYGWSGTNPNTSGITRIKGYELGVGYTGNDYFVGDNLGNEFNGRSGTNTFILGSGTNIVTAIDGTNTISSSSAVGQTIGNNTLNFETVNNAHSGSIASVSTGNNTMTEVFLKFTSGSTETTFFSAGGDTTAFFGNSGLASSFQVRTGTSGFLYSTVQAGIISTINGSDYTTAVTNTPNTNSSFGFHNVYSGAATIYGNAGNSVFIDNIGTSAQIFNGSADRSSAYYLTPTQIPTVTVIGAGSSVYDILRIPGATPTNLTTLFSNAAKFTGIEVIDLRSGTDTLNTGTNTITMGAGSTSHTNTFNISDTELLNFTHVTSGATATLILKLDSGSTINLTHPSSNLASSSSGYFGNIYTLTYTADNTHVVVDVHYGTG